MDVGDEQQGVDVSSTSAETNLLGRLVRQDFHYWGGNKKKDNASTTTKGLAGQSNIIASKASCDRAYWAIGHSQLYFALQNSLRYPTSQQYVERLIQESQSKSSRAVVIPRVAVLTRTTVRGSSYFVAQELALLGVDLILAGKSLKKLKQIQEKIQREGYVRSGKTPKITVRKLPYHPQRLADVHQGAKSIRQILREHYNDQLPILIHGLASVQTAYNTTPDGVESNQAHQFLHPHFLTQQLLPSLKNCADTPNKYRPRVIYVSSVGHCQGTDFNFERFVANPEQGGAPQWTFESSSDGNEEETTPGAGQTATTRNLLPDAVAKSAKASLQSLQNTFQQSFSTPFRSQSSDGSRTASKSSMTSFSNLFRTRSEDNNDATDNLLTMKQRLSLEKQQQQQKSGSSSYVPPAAILQSTEESHESSSEEEEEEDWKEEEEKGKIHEKATVVVPETEERIPVEQQDPRKTDAKDDDTKEAEILHEEALVVVPDTEEEIIPAEEQGPAKNDPTNDDIIKDIIKEAKDNNVVVLETEEERIPAEQQITGKLGPTTDDDIIKEAPETHDEESNVIVVTETEGGMVPTDKQGPEKMEPKEDIKAAEAHDIVVPEAAEAHDNVVPGTEGGMPVEQGPGEMGPKEDIKEAETPKESFVGIDVSVEKTTTSCKDAEHRERGKIASMADTEAFALVKMYYRSKMASLADSIALGREEPSLAVLSVYPGSVEAAKPKKGLGIADAMYQTAFKAFQLSPSQAARSTLRAALDPDVNTHETFLHEGTYLHCDGNPWTVADPTVLKNAGTADSEGQPYTLGEYATHVRASARKLCNDLLPQG